MNKKRKYFSYEEFRFKYLPDELKIQIASYLDPESILNFSNTCKEHYNLIDTKFILKLLPESEYLKKKDLAALKRFLNSITNIESLIANSKREVKAYFILDQVEKLKNYLEYNGFAEYYYFHLKNNQLRINWMDVMSLIHGNLFFNGFCLHKVEKELEIYQLANNDLIKLMKQIQTDHLIHLCFLFEKDQIIINCMDYTSKINSICKILESSLLKSENRRIKRNHSSFFQDFFDEGKKQFQKKLDNFKSLHINNMDWILNHESNSSSKIYLAFKPNYLQIRQDSMIYTIAFNVISNGQNQSLKTNNDLKSNIKKEQTFRHYIKYLRLIINMIKNSTSSKILYLDVIKAGFINYSLTNEEFNWNESDQQVPYLFFVSKDKDCLEMFVIYQLEE